MEEPGGARRSQGDSKFITGGARRSHEGPGGARRSQGEPGGARRSQPGKLEVHNWRSQEELEEPGGARRSQVEPGLAMRSQEEP